MSSRSEKKQGAVKKTSGLGFSCNPCSWSVCEDSTRFIGVVPAEALQVLGSPTLHGVLTHLTGSRADALRSIS